MTACQPQTQPEETQNFEFLRPFLATLEDMSWTSGYAKDSEGIAERQLAQSAEQYLGILLSPFAEHPRYGPPDELQSAGHLIFVYRNRDIAIQSFEAYKDLASIGNGWGYYEGDFDPRLENIYVGCSDFDDPSIGVMQECQAIIQYDRYITLAHALADGQTVTMQDWATLLDVVQTRLLSQAVQESPD